MGRHVRWSSIEEELAELGKPALLRLIKELFNASAENQAFLATRFAGANTQADVLEPYRKRIVDQFFPARGFGKLGLREARKAITDYRRATKDLVGTLELMLVYVENGTRFTNEYGDIEESFYNSMESMLLEAAKLVRSHPEFYPQFQERFQSLVRETSGIGWGYHDTVTEIAEELEAQINKATR